MPANYTCIQNAINAAEDGDVVILQPGCYKETIDFCGKAITVRSCDPTDPEIVATTILDGCNSYGESVVIFDEDEECDSQLLGVTIVNGTSCLGGAILCDGASPTIQYNQIMNNGFDPSTPSGAPVKAKDGETKGGGIAVVNGASPLIDHNTIVLNLACLGGGIYVSGTPCQPTISNNVISANVAIAGGGIYADLGAVVTINCNDFGTAPNGALCAQAAALKQKMAAAQAKKPAAGPAPDKAAARAPKEAKVAPKPRTLARAKALRKDCYSGNSAIDGGALFVEGARVISTDNRFVNNAATDAGGAIWGLELCLNSTGDLFDRNFTNDLETLIIPGGSGSKDVPTGYGGAIALIAGQADIATGTFTYNTSGDGGAIALVAGSLNLDDTTFDHNLANSAGGAVSALSYELELEAELYNAKQFDGVGAFSLSVETCTFTHNGAEYGGAIYGDSEFVLIGDNVTAKSDGESKSPLAIADCTFTGNVAVCESGGAIYVEDCIDLSVDSCVLQDNFADYYGAAIAVLYSEVVLSDNQFLGNVGPDFCYGTVYLDLEEERYAPPPPAAAKVDVQAELAKTKAKAAKDEYNEVYGNSFVRNIGYSGGGLYVVSGYDLDIYDNTFTENIVNGEGGAIYWDNDDSWNWIYENVFTGNNATEGGAIFVEDSCLYNYIEGNRFVGNFAGGAGFPNQNVSCDGGGLYLGDLISVTNNTFCSNSAGHRGGAIFNEAANCIVNNSLANNWAVLGGGVYNKACLSGTAAYRNNIIAFSKRGGGVFFDGTAPLFTFNNVFGNIAQNYVNTPDLTGVNGNISCDPLFVDVANCNLLLQSVGGHWDEASGTFIRDNATSPSIDAGDPCDDFSCEVQPNGCRINQGAEGGTRFASKSSMFAAVFFGCGEDGVSRTGPFTFIFRENMVRDSVASHMSVVPAICATSSTKQITNGLTWCNKRVLTFRPFPPLDEASDYRIVFGPYIRTSCGFQIPFGESFAITTGIEPVVTDVEPPNGECNVSPDSTIEVTFDQPMHTASVENCFSIKPRVNGSFEWNSDDTGFVFTPDDPLILNQVYKVTIGACSRAADDGVKMGRNFCWQFRVGEYSDSSSKGPASVTAAAVATAKGAQITVSLASAASVGVSIRNVAGVEIASLPARNLDKGVSTLLWDGKSKLGTVAPAGRYLLQVSAVKSDGTQANCLATLQR